MRKTRNPAVALLLLLVFFLACQTSPSSLAPLPALKSNSSQDIPCEWSGIEKIIAVGDLHGDYGNFVTILKAMQLIDKDLHWTGKKTHLVQTGDVIDRGPDAKKIFDLLMKLEKEAEEAGGKIHVLIGNHEEMNITGIAFDYPGYVTVEQFISFLPDSYRAQKEKKFRSGGGDDGALREFWREIIEEDTAARRKYTEYFNQEYGKWLLGRNAVIKINDTVFVHGGISEKYSTWKLTELNSLIREELRRAMRKESFTPKILYVRDGPLWYRDLALTQEEFLEKQVERILSNLGARQMVIAHTPRLVSALKINDMRRFGGKVWIIDTGISAAYGGHMSALIIDNGNFSIWGVDNE